MVATSITITGVKEAQATLTRLREGAEAAGRTTLRVGPTAKYASYVEQGTRRMRARPFLAPALATVEDSLRGRLIAALPKGAQSTAAAMLGVATTLKSAAQKRAPVRTGNLRGSMYVASGRR
ncbi:MAG TPA: HK97-gp10 family putative phage morphogenesis protein [Chloroflexota bacterium]|nr:HK97-gp10 family putative phage morphogenesis protein [Chloroflexota bacterium]